MKKLRSYDIIEALQGKGMIRMLLENQSKQLSFYSTLYEKIPENHFLKKVNRAVDFSFINSLLEKSYCKHFGRPAKEPEMMLKLLFLQYLYNLSDVKVIEEASYNLAFLWFLGLNPEDSLPDASLLVKFRTLRMKDITLDEVPRIRNLAEAVARRIPCKKTPGSKLII